MSESLPKSIYYEKVSVPSRAKLDFLAIISGVMIAAQARANGELSAQLGNSLQAAFLSFSSGLIIIIIISIFSRRIKNGLRLLQKAIKSKELPRWRLLAGTLGGSFVAIQTSIVPIIGVALYSVASIAGQALTSLLVDRIGITGGGPKKITTRRIAAALITVIAVLVSVGDRFNDSNFSFTAITLAVLAGAFVGVQRALNGQINEYSKESFATSLLNFITGSAVILIFLVVANIFSSNDFAPLPKAPWWIYTGGVIGVIYIAATSLIVQHLGVLTFTIFSVGGQLAGSLALDLFAPQTSNTVGPALLAGIALTYIGVLVSREKVSNGLKN